ncbi:MAG: ABC-type transport auxiliary lipoprotein family protein [Reyranella sp.]|nr:ABC-type transport auxiliary lipoprotein family protein [Reyranella sp.]
MSHRNPVLALGLALLLAACSIGKPIPQATTYVVEAPPPAARLSGAGAYRSEIARMGNVRVAAAFSGNSLVYRRDDVTYQSDPYEAFIADPSAMLGNQIAAWLDRAGPFKAVVQPGNAQTTRYVLEATVTELYGDFRPGRAPAAVLAIQFALVDATAIRTTTVFERTISRRATLDKATPDALVRGYGSALSGILSELVGDLSGAGLR